MPAVYNVSLWEAWDFSDSGFGLRGNNKGGREREVYWMIFGNRIKDKEKVYSCHHPAFDGSYHNRFPSKENW